MFEDEDPDSLLDDDIEDEELLDDDSDEIFEMPKKQNKSIRSGKTDKHNSGKEKKKRIFMFVGIVCAVLIGVTAIIIERYTPSKERMSGYDYFNTGSGSDQVLILMNSNTEQDTGVYIQDRVYLKRDFVADRLNQRFYFDTVSDSVIYTTAAGTIVFKTNENTYIDEQGAARAENFPVVREINGTLYIDLEYAHGRSDFIYQFYQEPNRVVIDNEYGSKEYVDILKDDAVVRREAGIKSPILEDIPKGERVFYKQTSEAVKTMFNAESWVEVQTLSGYTGYIQKASVSEVYTDAAEKVKKEVFPSIRKDYKISLSWFQVTNITANNSINSYLEGTKGITTIAPTWYSITSNEGDLSSLATKAFVDNMHSKGLEVWPLIDDFNTTIDGMTLYSNKNAREKIISTLISDALKYGYDGINLDCEKVTKEVAKHYLQFVREMSVECRKNNLVLSADNYKPASFNAFYDLAEQAEFLDYIIIMGYDEHYAGSDSGSVASIGFVEEGIKGGLEKVAKEKLINAIPFYTRIWTVSETGTTSVAVGMDNAINHLNTNGAPAVWDEVSGQYFGSYEKDGAVVKVWLEEDKSVEKKMQLIKQYGLAGVAHWKLGLEKNSVWDVIVEYNQ